MKDPFHHRKNVQKKVIQSIRKESEQIKINHHSVKLPEIEVQPPISFIKNLST